MVMAKGSGGSLDARALAAVDKEKGKGGVGVHSWFSIVFSFGRKVTRCAWFGLRRRPQQTFHPKRVFFFKVHGFGVCFVLLFG